jgi:ankyrin repeat protein
MTQQLPAHPSLENLKKQAKTLQKLCIANDAEALARLREHHPQYQGPSGKHLNPEAIKLSDCQLTLAREYGFESWPQLKASVEAANLEQAEEFVTIACLCFDDPHYDHRTFHQRAHRMLLENTDLAKATIWSASAAGSTVAVRAFLDQNNSLIDHPGPYGWTPLICACYSRVQPIDSAHSTFEVAKLLLDRGVNPNPVTLKGNADERLDQTARRYTALTGVFGGGSTGNANQPPHPHYRELAELLLTHGADPADEESLRNNPDDSLEILLRHGLKPGAQSRRPTKNGKPRATLMGRALCVAALRGKTQQVQILLDHGASTTDQLDGRTPWQHAMERGNLEIAHLLEAAGAPVTNLNEVERFVSLCLAGDEPAARAMLTQSPDLIQRAPYNMVQKAVGAKRIEAVRLALDLGFDPNAIEDNAAIHAAGAFAEHEEMLRLLLARGASLQLREPWYDGTGIGWADFFDYRELRDRLLNETEICLFDALDFDRLDRIPDILARDPEALERPFAKRLTRDPKPEDWQTPLVRMVDRGQTEAVRALLAHGANPNAHHPDGRTLLQLAHDNHFPEIAALLTRDKDNNAKS